MAALDIQVPLSPRIVDENGNLTPEWLIFVNQIVDILRRQEERLDDGGL